MLYAAGGSGSTDTGLPVSVLHTSPAFTGTATFVNLTASGTITPNQTAGIVGTTAANTANAGSVGEYITAAYTNFALVTATPTNVASISLSAGDWDVEGFAHVACTGSTTWTAMQVGINNTSATFPVLGFYSLDTLAFTAVTAPSHTMFGPQRHVLQAATTTWYLVVSATFSAGSAFANGYIRARRVR